MKQGIVEAARRLGFELCGIAPAVVPEADRQNYLRWIGQGFQGEMRYMERQQRRDARLLLPAARSVICVGTVYNAPRPKFTECADPTRGWIARYAWGADYHRVLRERMQKLVEEMRQIVGRRFEAKICVDTGPVLERALAQAAGLGWIAKNTCLIHPKVGSWFFLGEILTDLEFENLEPEQQPVANRCGACTRCIEACPTGAIVEPYVLDSARCISYLTIELRGPIPEAHRPQMGRHVFGCDICQDVCPWNRKSLLTSLAEFQPRPLASEQEETPESPTTFNPPLDWLAGLTEEEFRQLFRTSAIKRTKYRGFLRNVAVAMGNSREPRFRPVLEKLAQQPDPIVQEHARWALKQMPPRDVPCVSEPRAGASGLGTFTAKS